MDSIDKFDLLDQLQPLPRQLKVHLSKMFLTDEHRLPLAHSAAFSFFDGIASNNNTGIGVVIPHVGLVTASVQPDWV
jgi:hypothetical protein